MQTELRTMASAPKRFSVIISLALSLALLTSATASAGELRASPLSTVSGTSDTPFAACTADTFSMAEGTNYANTEVEPFVAVNPANEANIAAVWQQDRFSTGGSRGHVIGTSFDGGATWRTITETKTSVCTGGTVENGGDYERVVDPWVSFGPTGDLYLASMPMKGPPSGGAFNVRYAIIVNKSTDGGLTWSDPTTLIRESSTNVQDDKPAVTADPANAGLVYVVWTRYVVPSEQAAPAGGEHSGAYRAAAWFSRTTDGGATWEPARPIYDPGQQMESWANQIVVLPDNGTFNGELVNVLESGNPFGRKNAKGAREQLEVAVIRSPDKGVTWSPPTVVDKLLNLPVRDPLIERFVQAGRDAPDIAVDRENGNLYVVWHDGRFSDFQYNDVAFSMSSDGGISWSAPVKVNLTPPTGPALNRQSFTPSVEVLKDGTVGVSYYDFRNNGTDASEAEPLETDRFIVHCHSPSATDADRCADPDGWSETTITPTSFNLRDALRNRFGSYFLGDYVGLAAAGNRFATVFPRSNSMRDRSTVYFSSIP